MSAGITHASNSSGVTLQTVPTINGVLNFTAGRLIAGANTPVLGINATVTGAGPGQYVFGSLTKLIGASTAALNFHIGDAINYTPVNLTFAGTTNATGSLTASTTLNDHPSINSNSFLDASLSVNRYWSIVNNGVTGITSYNTTFNFINPDDLDPGVETDSLVVRRFSSGVWSNMLPVITATTSTSGTVSGVTFGDFQIGQKNGNPEFTDCPENISDINTADLCSGTAFFNASATNFASLTYDHLSGSSFPVGITTVRISSK